MNVGKAGSDIAALAEALGRLVSLVLRLPSPLAPNERADRMVEQLRGIGGSRSVGFGPAQVRSLPDAVALALAGYLAGKTPATTASTPHSNPDTEVTRWTGNLCPDCGSTTLVMEEGCKKCYQCGYSEC